MTLIVKLKNTILTSMFHVKMLRRCGVSSTLLNKDTDSD